MKTKLPEIDTWGFITGSYRINDETWKSSFPQNIFGRIIGNETHFKTEYAIMRCYFRKRPDGKHSHMRVSTKFFKKYED